MADSLTDPTKCHAFSMTDELGNDAPTRSVPFPIKYRTRALPINVTLDESDAFSGTRFVVALAGGYLFTLSVVTLVIGPEVDGNVAVEIVKDDGSTTTTLAAAVKGQQAYKGGEVSRDEQMQPPTGSFSRIGGSVSVVINLAVGDKVFTRVTSEDNQPVRITQVDFTGVYVGAL